MFVGFASGNVIGAAIGFVAGAFTPAIGRKIKALWVKDTQKAITSVKTTAVAAETAVKTEAEKVAAKL